MKYLNLLLLCLLMPTAIMADGWETQYKQIEQSIRQPKFADREFMITKYGASPDATPEANQKAINKAIEACAKAGGGKVVVPAGTFNTGAITLKSHVNLVVEKGATLLFAFKQILSVIAIVCVAVFGFGVFQVLSDDVMHRTPLWWKRGGKRFLAGFGNALFYALIMLWFVSCSSGLYWRPYYLL